jgi:hypothetical protein
MWRVGFKEKALLDAKGRGTLIAKALGWHRPFDGNDNFTLKPKAVRWQSMGTLKAKPFDYKGPSMAKALSSMANSLRWQLPFDWKGNGTLKVKALR